VTDEGSKPALVRRVPGANLRGKAVPSSSLPGLSEEALRQLQAAVEAERVPPGQPGRAVASPEPVRSEKSAGGPPQRPETGA
jgi:hypothetical protein